MDKENKKVEVRKSNIHGSGVIAKTNIKEGELVTFVKGPIRKKINLNIKDVFPFQQAVL